MPNDCTIPPDTKQLIIESLPLGGFVVTDGNLTGRGWRSSLAAFSALEDALLFMRDQMKPSAEAKE